MFERLTRRGLWLVFVVLLAGCARKPSVSSDARSFKLGITSGAQEFIDFVMEQQKLLDQAGLKIEKVKEPGTANVNLMLSERKVDIGFGGITSMAVARNQGKDVIVVYGVISPVDVVMVPKDSPVKSLSDLKGKKLGVFGGPGSTTLSFLAVLARKFYGIDLLRDVELVSAPAGALSGLLLSNMIDAALFPTIESIQLHADDRFRVLTDLNAEYKERLGGRVPAHVTIVTNEEFARSHPDVVKDYVKAYKNTVDYIHAHPDAVGAYAASIKVNDDKVRMLFREKLLPNLVERWDAEQAALENDFLKLVHDTLGESVLKTVPSDLIRTDYAP
jgi:NitT/TauT family transport system substrate-binding protein